METCVRPWGCLLALAIVLAGCAQVPMADPAADATGRRFDPPRAGMSALYLYRNAMLGSEAIFNLTENQRQIGSLADKTWLRIDLAPGRHIVGCSITSTLTSAQGAPVDTAVDVGSGEIRFLEVDVRPGPPLSPRCVATEVSADQGRAAVTAGRRAMAAP